MLLKLLLFFFKFYTNQINNIIGPF